MNIHIISTVKALLQNSTLGGIDLRREALVVSHLKSYCDLRVSATGAEVVNSD